MSCQTIIKYTDTALPVQNTPVTLFNSATAFPPGGSFHLLGLQWFQWSILMESAGDAATGTVQGQYSLDKGVTWETFYASTTFDSALVTEDEVYVGLYKDIRFNFIVTAATADTTAFSVNLALNPQKASSKTAPAAVDLQAADVLVDSAAV